MSGGCSSPVVPNADLIPISQVGLHRVCMGLVAVCEIPTPLQIATRSLPVGISKERGRKDGAGVEGLCGLKNASACHATCLSCSSVFLSHSPSQMGQLRLPRELFVVQGHRDLGQMGLAEGCGAGVFPRCAKPLGAAVTGLMRLTRVRLVV